MQLMVSRDIGLGGAPIAHFQNEIGNALCCDKFVETMYYNGSVTVVMCGACVILKNS